jgi:hypothetical protein
LDDKSLTELELNATQEVWATDKINIDSKEDESPDCPCISVDKSRIISACEQV